MYYLILHEPPFCKSDIAIIWELIVLFNPVIKLELELIVLKLHVIVELELFIHCVFDEILLKFALIKLELELILLKLDVIVELKLFIKFVFDEILLKFVFEVIVRLPIKMYLN